MVCELERTEGMSDVLDGVRLAVGEVIARIDAPRSAGARMAGGENAGGHRIAQIDCASGRVDLGSQHARGVRKFTRSHAPQQVEVLFHRSLPPRAVASG